MRTLNLTKDYKELISHLKRRIKDYPVYVNAGPGKDADEISLITLGFSFEQSGWYALIFDTRPNATLDGHWQDFIEENCVEKKVWCMDDVDSVDIKHYDPKWREPKTALDDRYIAKLFGKLLKEVLVEAKTTGLFDSLPLAKSCALCVEEHEGRYGWLKPKRSAE